jgi:O-antigen/teichoic acid export membrane protein
VAGQVDEMIKDFVEDIVKYLPAQIAPGIVGVISIPIVTRLFSPGEYGNYSIVVATVMVLTTILGWLPMGIIRFYPAYERDQKLDLFYGIIFKLTVFSLLVVTGIFMGVLVLTKTLISPKLYFLMYVGVGVYVFTSIFNVFQYLLRAERRINWYSVFAVWRSVMGLGLGLGIIFLFETGIVGLFWGAILSIVLILPFLWKHAMGSISVLRNKIKMSLLKEMANYSFPLVAGNLAAWILSLSDRFILEFYRGSKEVGIYSASYNISDRSIMLLINLFMLASGPIAMNIWENKGEEKSSEFIAKLTRYYLIISVPLIVGFSVLDKPIMSFLTGEQYFEGHKIIPFVVVGGFLFGLQHRYQSGILFHKRTGYITLGIAAAAVLNLGLNLLFIPRYGYTAAAVTTATSYLFLLMSMILVSRKFFVWKFPFLSLLKICFISAIVGVMLHYFGGNSSSITLIHLLFIICLGVVIYFALLFLFREIKPNEEDAIKQIITRYSPCGLIHKK